MSHDVKRILQEKTKEKLFEKEFKSQLAQYIQEKKEGHHDTN